MKHKATKYGNDGAPKAFVLELKPEEVAALYMVLGHIQTNHLQESLTGIANDTLFNLVSELGNLGNADYENGWNEIVNSKAKKWLPSLDGVTAAEGKAFP